MYLIVFVDSASRWMRPYGMRRKSETAAYVQKFIADMNGMGRPNCFRTDNGGESISRDYVDYCDSVWVHHECTAPGKPHQNAVVESAIWRAMKGGHAARLEIGRLFPDVDLGKIPFWQPSVARGCPVGFRLFQPLRDQGEHRMAVIARGFLRATAGICMRFLFASRHDADRSEHQVRCPSG